MPCPTASEKNTLHPYLRPTCCCWRTRSQRGLTEANLLLLGKRGLTEANLLLLANVKQAWADRGELAVVG
eukprot:3810980-Pleurochrysis_carterae.AAC.1